jgi:hypothetical protein
VSVVHVYNEDTEFSACGAGDKATDSLWFFCDEQITCEDCRALYETEAD